MDGVRSWLWRVTTPADLALGLALAVGSASSTLLNPDAPSTYLRALLATVATLSLLLRTRFPLVAAAVMSAALTVESLATESPDEMPVLLAIVVLAYSVWAHAPARRAWVGSVLLGASASLAVAVDPSDSLDNVVPTLLLFIAVPGGIGWGVHRRTSAIAALELETAALTREAEAALEEERRRIARELHDVVSHAVTLIAVQAEAGQAVIERDPALAERSLEAIGRASRDALGELDRMLGLLRETEQPTDEGLGRLPALVEGARAAGLDVSVTETGHVAPLSADADHCAFRVVQEGVTNALRHAAGSAVTIHLDHGDGGLDVTVSSVGHGHASTYGGTGRGLAGLRERLVRLGGDLDTRRSDDASFVLHARIPAGGDA